VVLLSLISQLIPATISRSVVFNDRKKKITAAENNKDQTETNSAESDVII